MPKVSVCIPTYNKPESLRRGLTSIAGQAYRDFEVVVTDDTPDGSVEAVVKDFGHMPSLRYFRNKARKGTPENLNEAIRHAEGAYIKMLCDDDWFATADSLGQFVAALEKDPNVSLAFCLSKNVSSLDGSEKVRPVPPGFLRRLRRDPRTIFPRNFIGSPSAVIFKKKDGRSFDPRLKWVVDILLYADILKERGTFVFIDRPLINVTTQDPSQVTSQVRNNKQVELFEWFYAYRKIYDKLPRRLEVIYWFYRLLKKYRVRSVSEIPEFDLIPNDVQRAIRLYIKLPDILGSKQHHGQ